MGDGGNHSEMEDPWKRAQEGPFSVSAVGRGGGPAGVGTPPGSYGASPESRRGPDAGPGPSRHPGYQGRPARALTGKAVGVLAVVAGTGLVVGAVVLVLYFYAKSSTQAASSGISLAERTRAEVTLGDAATAEKGFFAEKGYFTDDLEALRAAQPNMAWEAGSDPQVAGRVYVEVCDFRGSSVLLQLKSEQGNVFAMWLDGAGGGTYYAVGPVGCPRIGGNGLPEGSWKTTSSDGWSAGSEGEPQGGGSEELPPPVSAPRVPSVPNPYGISSPASGGGGSSPEPYGGGGSYGRGSGGGGSSGGGY